MAGSTTLEPPIEDRQADTGANKLAEYSDSEDQFTDAQSGPASPRAPSSPIPETRVERVDNEPAHGEVPGTEAYEIRESDAKPDEITVVPDESDPQITPQFDSIATTAVEEPPGPLPLLSEEAEEKRIEDAKPDILVKPDDDVEIAESEPINDTTETQVSTSLVAPEPSTRARRRSSRSVRPIISPQASGDEAGDDDDFGDDFDDFEEGGEEEDFDDFEDGFQQSEPPAETPRIPPLASQILLPFPIPDFKDMAADDILSTTDDCLMSLFPPEMLDVSSLPPLTKEASTFTSTRSASLWSQLVAPPPLAPPDWIRSRTRRLFLVSLGVPIDLDEILPASKQKKLVLPSLAVPSSAASPRASSDSRSASRLKQGDGNNSSTSVDTSQGGGSKKKKGVPLEPEFDMVAARHLCSTTDEALDGFTEEELKTHVKQLKALQGTAREVLEHWQKRTDEMILERETFEGVIENLVKHARKVRK